MPCKRISKVPCRVKAKMHRLAWLYKRIQLLENEITDYFVGLGYSEDFLRSGTGRTLDDLQDGSDITDEFCAWIESGEAAETFCEWDESGEAAETY